VAVYMKRHTSKPSEDSHGGSEQRSASSVSALDRYFVAVRRGVLRGVGGDLAPPKAPIRP
jgi:hypothetical protein